MLCAAASEVVVRIDSEGKEDDAQSNIAPAAAASDSKAPVQRPATPAPAPDTKKLIRPNTLPPGGLAEASSMVRQLYSTI